MLQIEPQLSDEKVMKFKIFLVLAITFTAFGLSRNAIENQKPSMASRGPASDANSNYGWPNSCVGKKFCITVFVAPWCPICKGSQATFKLVQQYISQNREDVGFGLVMSTGESDARRREKNILAPVEVTLDDSEIIMRNRRIAGFPTWIVNDGSGNEVFNKSGARTVKSISEVSDLLEGMGID